MMRAASLRLAAFLLLAASLAPSLAAQGSWSDGAPLEPAPDGLRRVAVFLYKDRGSSLRSEHAFARFAVADMLRLTLMEEAGLEPLEGGEAADTEEGRREAALALGADHFVWGYLSSEGPDILLIHHIVEAQSGRLVHMASERLKADASLFDALEASARGFASWVRVSLPPRAPERVVVEKEVLVEREVSAPRPAADRAILGFGGGVLFFLGELAPSLGTTGGGGLSFTFGRGPLDPLRLGLALDLALLVQKDALFSTAIAILNPSLSLRASWPLALGKAFGRPLGVVPELGAGANLIFGRVGDQLISYLRPLASGGLSLRMDLPASLCLCAGTRATAVFAAWGLQTMIHLSPYLELGYRP